MISEKKVHLKVYVTQTDLERLDALGLAAGKLTANAFAGIVLSEIASIPANSAAVWAALARIAEEAESYAPAVAPVSSPAPRLKPRRRPESASLPAHAETR
jgi:hypothetical protein